MAPELERVGGLSPDDLSDIALYTQRRSLAAGLCVVDDPEPTRLDRLLSPIQMHPVDDLKREHLLAGEGTAC